MLLPLGDPSLAALGGQRIRSIQIMLGEVQSDQRPGRLRRELFPPPLDGAPPNGDARIGMVEAVMW
jgi:hypothetical protein